MTPKSYDTRLRTPIAMIEAGCSGSGKSTFCFNLVRSWQIITDSVSRPYTICYYKEKQNIFKHVHDLVDKWINELPTLESIKDETSSHKSRGSLVIIDDFVHELKSDIIELFTVYRHHGNCSVILLAQNLFDKNPIFRTLSLNSTYICAFKNPRDKLQITSFARQFYPGKSKFVIDSFNKATARPYSYMMFDFHQETPEELRIRSRILPSEYPSLVWIPT